MKRQNRVVTPGGTITDSVFDVRGNVIKTYIGTNDDGATESDPTGGGVDPDNNMVPITANEFDNNVAGFDGNLTKVTQYAAASDTRVTTFTYDFRNRRIDTDGEIDFYEKSYYDNLDRVTQSERYNTSSSGNLIARSETKFDDRGRVYQTIRYAVNVGSGSPGALSRAEIRFAQRALPTYEWLIEALRQAGVVHADETGWRVSRRNAWLWVFASKDITI